MVDVSPVRPTLLASALVAMGVSASLAVGSAYATGLAPAATHLTDVATATAAAVTATLWIDVRTPEEFAQGHLDGAINVPLDVIAQQIAFHAPDKSTPVALYCRSGRRAALAQDILLELGYTNVTNQGGYDELVRRGVKVR